MENYSKIENYLKSDLIICADGGARHLRKLGLTPSVLLGDFDSINEEDYSFYKEHNVKILNFPKDKDFTDTELAIEQAISMGASEIVILGATGGRLDHTMANVFLLRKILERGVNGKIVTENDEMILVKDFAEIEGDASDNLTLLALDKEVYGVTTTGLKFPLRDEILFNGSSRGVSNSFEESFAQIAVKSGILMVIKSKEKN